MCTVGPRTCARYKKQPNTGPALLGQKSQLLQTAERTNAATPNAIGEDRNPRASQKVKGLID